jgi:hypothetical protein
MGCVFSEKQLFFGDIMSLFVQRTVAQLPWWHNICFSEEINEPIGIASWETAIEIEKLTILPNRERFVFLR